MLALRDSVNVARRLFQLLLNDVLFDSLTTVAQQITFAPGIDYMTSVEDWLDVQVTQLASFCLTRNGETTL